MNALEWRESSGTPGVSAVVVEPGSGRAFAAVMRDDALRLSAEAVDRGARLAPRLVAWSGSLAEEPFARDPRTWGPAGLEAFREAAARLAPILRARNATLLLRPHARHVLCDPQRCVTLVHQWRERGEPFGLALDAAAMIEDSMAADAGDHLRRAMEWLSPLAAVVFVREAPPGGSGDEPVMETPLGSGTRRADAASAVVSEAVPWIRYR